MILHELGEDLIALQNLHIESINLFSLFDTYVDI